MEGSTYGRYRRMDGCTDGRTDGLIDECFRRLISTINGSLLKSDIYLTDQYIVLFVCIFQVHDEMGRFDDRLRVNRLFHVPDVRI